MSDLNREVKYTKHIAGHPVVPVLSRMLVEMGQYRAYDVSIHWEQSALFLEDRSGKVVSALSFQEKFDRPEYFVNAVYVLPEYRGLGHYSMLFAVLKKRAKENGILSISGTIAWDNEQMRLVAEAVGRRPVAVTYSMEV